MLRYVKQLTVISCICLPALVLAEAPYITGGIGKDERKQLEAKRSDYNFEVKSALKTGHFTGDVHITIVNAEGDTVLDASTDGPLFYVKLEKGSYSVTGKYEDQTKTQKFTIGDEPMREVIFRWDGDEPVVKVDGEAESVDPAIEDSDEEDPVLDMEGEPVTDGDS